MSDENTMKRRTFLGVGAGILAAFSVGSRAETAQAAVVPVEPTVEKVRIPQLANGKLAGYSEELRLESYTGHTYNGGASFFAQQHMRAIEGQPGLFHNTITGKVVNIRDPRFARQKRG